MAMTNIVNAGIPPVEQDNPDFVNTPKTPVKIQMWNTDGNIVKADIIGQWATEIDGKSISEHIATESPIEKRVDADDNLVLSINRNAQSFQVDYGITEFAAIYSNRDKNIWFRPNADAAIQSCISVSITADYAKFECLIDNQYFICQVDSADNWTKTQLDTSSVLVCDVHSTTYQEAFDASYCYVKDDEGIIFGLTEKTNQYIRFTNIDNDMRHIWTINTDNEWFLTDEALCENKMDVNPSALYVSTPDEAKLEVHDKQVYMNTPGQIYGHAYNVSINADNQWSLNAKTLYTNVNNLAGNLPTLVLKNLTSTYPEGNPRVLFTNKDGTQLSYVDNMDIGTMSAFFNNWTQADGSIKSKIETTTIEIED